MTDRTYLKLQPSEQVVASAAARIFAAYLSAGMVHDGNEEEWMQRSVREAIRIAKMADDAVASDGETT